MCNGGEGTRDTLRQSHVKHGDNCVWTEEGPGPSCNGRAGLSGGWLMTCGAPRRSPVDHATCAYGTARKRSMRSSPVAIRSNRGDKTSNRGGSTWSLCPVVVILLRHLPNFTPRYFSSQASSFGVQTWKPSCPQVLPQSAPVEPSCGGLRVKELARTLQEPTTPVSHAEPLS